MCWPIFCSDSLKSSIFRCRSLVSEPLAADLSASSLALTSLLTSSGMRDSFSLMTFSAWWIMWSAWLRSSTSSRLERSSAECASASLTIRSTSSLFGVEDERDLDLRHAPRGGRNAVQVEATQRPVVARHVALALEDVNLDRRLVVRRGREDLRARGRDRRVAVD